MTFRKAQFEDITQIWQILKNAIERRRLDGSDQWQDGYPSLDVVHSDILNEIGYVLEDRNEIVGYIVVIVNDEPAYEQIKGKWLSNNDFIVFHRIAISQNHLGKGYATQLMLEVEKLAKKNGVRSIKFDTNFDNLGMLHLAKKLDYTFCGEVLMRGNPRKAFEKLIEMN